MEKCLSLSPSLSLSLPRLFWLFCAPIDFLLAWYKFHTCSVPSVRLPLTFPLARVN